jgi:hypothetical protein
MNPRAEGYTPSSRSVDNPVVVERLVGQREGTGGRGQKHQCLHSDKDRAGSRPTDLAPDAHRHLRRLEVGTEAKLALV